MKKKNPLDYLKTWHYVAVALFFFVSIVTGIVIYAKDLEQNLQQNIKEIEATKTEVEKINLWRLNEKIWFLEDKYRCEDKECRDKMPEDIWDDYRDKLTERENKYQKLKKGN